jgi:hypothetical protein
MQLHFVHFSRSYVLRSDHARVAVGDRFRTDAQNIESCETRGDGNHACDDGVARGRHDRLAAASKDLNAGVLACRERSERSLDANERGANVAVADVRSLPCVVVLLLYLLKQRVVGKWNCCGGRRSWCYACVIAIFWCVGYSYRQRQALSRCTDFFYRFHTYKSSDDQPRWTNTSCRQTLQ